VTVARVARAALGSAFLIALAAGVGAGPQPGARLEIELAEAPVAAYEGAEWTEVDRRMATIFAVNEAVTYDPGLAWVARALARFQADVSGVAPSSVLDFLLDSAGAAVWSVRQSMVSTSEDGAAPIEDAIAQLEAGAAGGLRVGVGEVLSVGPGRRRTIAIVAAPSGFLLDRLSRRVLPRRRVIISGRLPEDVQGVELAVMYPDNDLVTVKPRLDGRRFMAEIHTRAERGLLRLEVLARSARGPTPLAQLELHVGGALPRHLATTWPPDESSVSSDLAAARLAYQLLNRARGALGLAQLRHDPRLQEVARAHSADMRDRGYIAHVSPRTGTVSDRLRRAGYRAFRQAENVARHVSIHQAHSGLMRSLGHRRNILDGALTHVGIGVAHKDSRGNRTWYVTQLFAQPVREVDSGDQPARVVSVINAARELRGLSPVRRDRSLSEVAQREAERGVIEPREVLDVANASQLTPQGAFTAVLQLWDMAQLELPEQVFHHAYSRLGVGVAQSDVIDEPSITLVLIAAH